MEGGRAAGAGSSSSSSTLQLPSHAGSLLSVSAGPAPDRLACPRKLHLLFPVFHRLTPQAALRALESSVLHPLTVNNRLHTFVHRDRHGKIFYLRLQALRRKDATHGTLTHANSFGGRKTTTTRSARASIALLPRSLAMAAARHGLLRC